MKLFVKGVFAFLLFITLLLLLGTVVAGYESSIRYIVSLANRPNRGDDLLMLLSSKTFLVIQFLFVFIALLFTVLLLKFDSLYLSIKKFIDYIFKSARRVYEDCKNTKFILVILIPIVLIVYWIINLKGTSDEAYTYLTFINKPFYNCLIFYPFPNNHVFYSFVANFFDCFPFINKLILIRIPAFLASIISWMLVYSLVKRYYSEKVAMSVVALFAISHMAVTFAVQARGYAFVSLSFIICLYATFNLIKKGNKTEDWIVLVVGGIFGFYSIPSFLYPYLTVNVFLLIYNARHFKQQIFYNIIVGIIVLLLYSPIMAIEGLDALINNKFVEPQNRMQIVSALPGLYKIMIPDLFGLPFLIGFIIVALSFIVSLKNKDKQIRVMWLLFLITPVVLLIGHSVIPYSRVFIYYSFIIPFLVCISLTGFIDRISVKFISIAIIIIQSISALYTIGEFEEFNHVWDSLDAMYDCVIEDDKSYYNVSGAVNFDFEMTLRGRESQVVTNDKTPLMDTDTVSGYDYIIIDVLRDATRKTKPYLGNHQQNIYKR